MKLGLLVQDHLGKQRLAVVQYADFCAFEEVHNCSMAKIEADMKVRDLGWLAWHCEKRNKVHSLSFEDWREGVAMVSLGESEDNKLLPLENSQPTG
jgi:hypothetical protein